MLPIWIDEYHICIGLWETMVSYTDCVQSYGELYRLRPSYIIYMAMSAFTALPRAARMTHHLLMNR